MNTKEVLACNYTEALLRAALLLGDLHRTIPIHEITISAFRICGHSRRLCLKCRIAVNNPSAALPCEDYIILYPLAERLSS